MGQRRDIRRGTRRLTAWAGALALAAVTASACSAGTEAVGDHPPAPTVAFGSTAPATSGGAAGTGASQNCDPAASSAAPDPAAVSDQQVQNIKKNGYIRVGVSADQFLTGYLNADGAEEGFDIDLAHALARSLFGDPNAVRFVALSTADRIPALVHDRVDLVIDTMTITCARLQQVSFSAVYFQASQRLLVTKGSPYTSIGQLAGKKVCAQSGSTSVAQIQKAKATALEVTNVSDCLVLLQENQVSAISTDDTLLAGLARQDPNLEVVGPRLEPEPYGIAMPHGETRLESWVNSVLAQYESGGDQSGWETSYQHWFLTSLGAAQPPVAQDSH
jgi:polar amino acid transport system substrate-binding protein